jgi:hypothetical protein
MRVRYHGARGTTTSLPHQPLVSLITSRPLVSFAQWQVAASDAKLKDVDLKKEVQTFQAEVCHLTN